MTGIERAAWLESRRAYIGASEAAAVLGISPYDSPHSVYLSKVEGVEKEETLPMRRGRHMEPFIIAEFERETGVKVLPGRFHQHPKWPFIACNTDGELEWKGHPAVIECKDVGFFAGLQFGTEGADIVAEHYLTQCAYQLIASGRKLACLCVLKDGRTLEKFWYTFDPALFEIAHVLDRDMAKSITFRVCQFWNNHIIPKIPPPLTAVDTDTDYVRTRRSEYDNGDLTNADEEIQAESSELAKEIPLFNELKARIEGRKNRMKLFLAERQASALETQEGIYTYRADTRGVASFRTPIKSGNA